MDGNLGGEVTYDPPNLTFPFGAYICVVDIDPGTGVVKVRRFVAVDDCGTRINEMIIEGQVHGGLTDGVGMALMQIIDFDDGMSAVLHGICADLDGGCRTGRPEPSTSRRTTHRRKGIGGRHRRSPPPW